MLKVHVKNSGEVAVLHLQGRIVIGETSALRNAVDSQTNVKTIVLDLARVSTIDAKGLSEMLELRQQCKAKGIALQLTNVTKLVRQVLKITRLDSVFKIAPVGAFLSGGFKQHPVGDLCLAR